MATAREEILAVIKYLKSHIVAGEAWLEQEAHLVEEKMYEVFNGAPKIAVDPHEAQVRAGEQRVFTGSVNVGAVQADPVADALKKAEAEVKAKQEAAATHAAEHGLVIPPAAITNGSVGYGNGDPLQPVRETVTLTTADVGTISAAAFNAGSEAGPANNGETTSLRADKPQDGAPK